MDAWLGDLWNFPFPADVYGTANGWAGALLTGFSFLLAANVYRKNRQDKRIEQASKVLFTWTASLDPDTDGVVRLKGDVYNHSDTIITDVAVIAWLTPEAMKKGSKRLDRFMNPLMGLIYYHTVQPDEHMNSVVMPDGTAPFAFELDPPYFGKVQPEQMQIELHFTDGNSVTWNRQRTGIPLEHHYEGRLTRWSIGGITQWRILQRKTKSNWKKLRLTKNELPSKKQETPPQAEAGPN
ncbi:hypothetical protein JF710_22795 [Mycobacterium intracellulare]|uniref:hypothetical protein n=1 Tax=Mycobacterium intracellulare TaxID=1767 RepID=UPI001CDA8206|nr:hypothetical protein [Mycobacterium intracellulare]MCA2256013.1 hypothetical protein [Mycobacterium intracellulare]